MKHYDFFSILYFFTNKNTINIANISIEFQELKQRTYIGRKSKNFICCDNSYLQYFIEALPKFKEKIGDYVTQIIIKILFYSSI